MQGQAANVLYRPTHVAGLLDVLEDQQLFCRQALLPEAIGSSLVTSRQWPH